MRSFLFARSLLCTHLSVLEEARHSPLLLLLLLVLFPVCAPGQQKAYLSVAARGGRCAPAVGSARAYTGTRQVVPSVTHEPGCVASQSYPIRLDDMLYLFIRRVYSIGEHPDQFIHRP